MAKPATFSRRSAGGTALYTIRDIQRARSDDIDLRIGVICVARVALEEFSLRGVTVKRNAGMLPAIESYGMDVIDAHEDDDAFSHAQFVPGWFRTDVSASGGRVAPYAAPDSELTVLLAYLLQSILGVDRVGLDDNFFALGGDSRSATDFNVKLRDWLGADVYIPPLHDSPTLREIERALKEQPGSMTQPLVAAVSGLPSSVYLDVANAESAVPGIRHSPGALIFGRNTQGSRPPLFFSSGMHKTLVSWMMGEDQPIYWMRSLLGLGSRSPENTRKLADHYVREILEIYPSGPLILGGYGEGARIAAHVAAGLEASGREIPLLFLIEQLVPAPYHGRTRMLFTRKSQFNPYFKFGAQEIPLRKYYRGDVGVSVLPWTQDRLLEPDILSRVMGDIRKDIADALGNAAIADAVPRCEQAADPQCFTAEDRNLLIHVSCPGTWTVNSRLELAVEVANHSPVEWLPYESSGLCVAVRWINELGHRSPVAAKLKLRTSLNAGEHRTIEMQVRTPRKPGRWILDVDMAEDGLCLFQEVTARTFHRKVFLVSGGRVIRAALGWWHTRRHEQAQ